MARKPRIEFAGAFYHVITRGNQKQEIFRDEEDYRRFLATLLTYKERYRFRLHAYVLMDNHVHLLIETADTPLSKALQGINQKYTCYFNRKYETVGHLFQGRYKAILCDKDSYLLTLLKYIHFNPVRANRVARLDEYPWSSHHAYLNSGITDELADTEQALRMFADGRKAARTRYLEFMTDMRHVSRDDIYATIDQRLLGDDSFVDDVKAKHSGSIRRDRKIGQCTLAEIDTAIQQRYDVSPAQLRSASKSRQIMHARKMFSAAARMFGHRGADIAEYLRKDPSSVSAYLQQAPDAEEVADFVDDLVNAGKNLNSKV